MKRMIVGMSMKRKDLGSYIDDHTFQVMVALAQLYLFHEGNRVHWRKEVWEKFSRIYKLKKTNRLPDAQFIFDNSWELNKQNVKHALKHAQGKETDYDPQVNASYDEFYMIVKDYFLWLSDRLSQEEMVDPEDVWDELDRLGLYETMNL